MSDHCPTGAQRNLLPGANVDSQHRREAEVLLRGVFGRDTRRAAEKALDAAEQLDLDQVLLTRRTAG
jgi:hypothetical protein